MENVVIPEDEVLEELLRILKEKKRSAELREILWDYHDNDIARVLEYLTPEERRRLYKALGVERVSDVFSYLDEVEEYFREIGTEQSADVLEEMDADDAVDVLETLPEEYREELIQEMEEEAQEDTAEPEADALVYEVSETGESSGIAPETNEE